MLTKRIRNGRVVVAGMMLSLAFFTVGPQARAETVHIVALGAICASGVDV